MRLFDCLVKFGTRRVSFAGLVVKLTKGKADQKIVGGLVAKNLAL